MSKQGIIAIVIVVILVIIAAILYFTLGNNNSSLENENQTINNSEEENVAETANNQAEENVVAEENTGKVLVVYFSAQNHTEAVAQRIAENLGADIFEITPVEEYTSDDLDWTDSNSRVSREHDDESLRNVELETMTVENWDS